MSDAAILADGLAKRYRLGWRRTVEVVRGVSFSVGQGEVLGFVGPNGAGKSTTIKMLLGLVTPTAGRAFLVGVPSQDPRSRRRVGYLPETGEPLAWPHLDAAGLLALVGGLSGMARRAVVARANELLDRLDLSSVGDLPVSRFSKGMLQRLGLAQALLADPEVLILDEPTSGLDPVGRHLVRGLVAELRAAGKAILLSTHALADVEELCDRAALLAGGALVAVGRPDELLAPRSLGTELVVEQGGARTTELIPDGADVDARVRDALAGGARVIAVTPRRESLEARFLRAVHDRSDGDRA